MSLRPVRWRPIPPPRRPARRPRQVPDPGQPPRRRSERPGERARARLGLGLGGHGDRFRSGCGCGCGWRRDVRRLALCNCVELRDQLLVVAFGLGLGGFDMRENHLDAVETRKNERHRSRGDRQLAVTKLAKHILARMSYRLEGRQTRNPQVPLMVWTKRKILDRIFGSGFCSSLTNSTSRVDRLSEVSVKNSLKRSSITLPFTVLPWPPHPWRVGELTP